ncbi:methyl-accepting chemotaxis protein [uncultured Neptuniibacter sp.]|uniref:methyl-accepting chemotaxis protein n=1 Tax=uncultured Neptuniibacter sp. TaxID=502143 RepID=UPI0026018C12|nr:methyl-accepting chemotaxis protein [uncultured Neptuniibacter sp.]
MSLNLTHKITLGFAALVVSILIVGGGGLVGNSNIYERLNHITEDTLPILVGSFNQMIELQQANQSLYSTLAEEESDKIESTTKQFIGHIGGFNKKLLALTPLVENTPSLKQQIGLISQQSKSYSNQANVVFDLHNTRLQLDKKVTEQALDLQGKADSVLAWTQRYLSNSNNSEGVIAARNLTRSMSKLRVQLTNFQRSGNLKALNDRVKTNEGDLLKRYEEFKQSDSKAGQITSLIPAIHKHFFQKDGLIDLYNRKADTRDKLAQQLIATHKSLAEVTHSANQFIAFAKQEAGEAQAAAQDANNLSRGLIIALLVGTTAFALVIAFITISAIRKPLSQFTSELTKLRDGDLTVSFNQSRKDEFGDLAESLNTVVSSQRQILQDVAKGSENLSSVAQKNSTISQQTTQAMHAQSEQLEMASSAATEMESSVTEVANHSATTLDAVHQCESLSQHVNRNVDQTLRSIQAQAEAINEAVSVSNSLANYSTEIDAILETIHAIAEQTNLLALNAAIEAARAGDHGRGFAVVADEVRGLASRTRNSTDEIQEMIENMKGSIQQVVSVMQSSYDQAQSCVGHANTSQESLANMNESIGNIRFLNTQIEDAAQQQRQAVQEVSTQLNSINHAASETSEGAEEASSGSDELLAIAQQQQGLLKRFTL